jgi:hypothetical protein
VEGPAEIITDFFNSIDPKRSLARQARREHREFLRGSLGVKSAYVTFTFQKIGALNLRMSRMFFRKAVGWNHSPHGTYVTSLRATFWTSLGCA